MFFPAAKQVRPTTRKLDSSIAVISNVAGEIVACSAPSSIAADQMLAACPDFSGSIGTWPEHPIFVHVVLQDLAQAFVDGEDAVFELMVLAEANSADRPGSVVELKQLDPAQALANFMRVLRAL